MPTKLAYCISTLLNSRYIPGNNHPCIEWPELQFCPLFERQNSSGLQAMHAGPTSTRHRRTPMTHAQLAGLAYIPGPGSSLC